MKGRKQFKAPLSTRTAKVCGVVTFAGFELYEVLDFRESLDAFLAATSKNWVTMVHWLDYDENGEEENIHIHFATEQVKVLRLGTLLNKIADDLGVNTLAVSVDKMISLDAQIEYFVHKKDPDKVQYCAYQMHSNMPFEEIKAILKRESEAETFDSEYLVELVQRCDTKTELMMELGVYRYRNLRGVINDLWQEKYKTDLHKPKEHRSLQA